MPSFADLANQARIAIRHPSENEESTLDLVLIQQVKDALGVAFHAAHVCTPTVPVDNPSEGLHVKIVLDVHRKDIIGSHTGSLANLVVLSHGDSPLYRSEQFAVIAQFLAGHGEKIALSVAW